MTGFGQAVLDDTQMQVSAEIKCLNSKFLDLNLRLPKVFSEKEMEVRNLISEKLERGKISITIEYTPLGESDTKQTYNEKLFKTYYNQLRRLADAVGDLQANIFSLALESPDVIQNKIREEVSEVEWTKVKACLNEAIKKCDVFRIKEGDVLGSMLINCCDAIRTGLVSIEKLDPQRVQRIRDKLKGNVVSFFGEQGFDSNRLEQEIIFYIEKLDINEEKVRLKSHLDYFLDALRETQSNGKKLSFISQEIGREINTIGSKANDAELQKHVVQMKEELEKIKEQLNNVL
ncbi:MAG TPA: YicC/YloC family endoribonuclease [Cyclobacteriaceae bacterium]|nr:YicC/YloC family endoribonuclease [Cyclobacteriaceae bacterium]